MGPCPRHGWCHGCRDDGDSEGVEVVAQLTSELRERQPLAGALSQEDGAGEHEVRP